MQFHGFSSIAAYERECARTGFTTERQTYHKDGEDYLLLITRLAQPTSTSVDTWHLFTADETHEVLSGIMPQGTSAAGQLVQHGYFSDDPAADDPAPAVELYPEDTGGEWQQYALFA
jgi:hypothetical protein